MRREARIPENGFGDAFVAQVEHPVLRELFAYWASKKRDGRLPRLADLDPPSEIPKLTAVMSIVTVGGDPPRFKYKRMGSAIAAIRRNLQVRDATGRYSDEIDYNVPRDHILAVYAEAVRLAQPYREADRYRSGEYTSQWYEWLLLPMSDNGAGVDALMTGYVTLAGTPTAPA